MPAHWRCFLSFQQTESLRSPLRARQILAVPCRTPRCLNPLTPWRVTQLVMPKGQQAFQGQYWTRRELQSQAHKSALHGKMEVDCRRLKRVQTASLPSLGFPRYQVTAEAVGFVPFQTDEFTVTAQQVFTLPAISLSVAGQSTSVVVRPTEVIAAEQIKTEEKQRVLGIVPNFYVSYVSDAAPLSSKQKLSLSVHDALDWASFAAVSVGAGAEQATNAFKAYGQGAAGYGKRWGALFATARSNDLLSHYVFASLFHQDPRYFYQGTGTKKSRLFHALSYAFVARGDNGKARPNYTYILGDLCSGALSNAYYPPANRGAGLVFTNAAIALAARAGQGVLEEFIGKRFTKNAPDSRPPEGTGPNGSPSTKP